MELNLQLTLKSDTTFGRGEGLAGLIDVEVEHDRYGLPFLRGRVLKGLLVEECANTLWALKLQNNARLGEFERAALFLFGQPGSTLNDDAHMRVGAALLPDELRRAVASDVDAKRLTTADALDSLTALRRQTAVDEETHAPEEGSLRTLRVILRETVFTARLRFEQKPDLAEREPDLAEQEPDAAARALLVACVKSLRRAGLGRNRGRGRLTATLTDAALMQAGWSYFTAAINPQEAA